ncbi:hypothetical protein CTA1_11987 [Colletotrichum tanaceti]|uniref:Uncharacterized protein n=1 Tax=Colletotrichum tanaceti TaxID=1306861 RepID=A0A4U6XGY1_9PEZI|nr:hypothetical protein CTA1_11987 [Colletotrichum tanaceti]
MKSFSLWFIGLVIRKKLSRCDQLQQAVGPSLLLALSLSLSLCVYLLSSPSTPLNVFSSPYTPSSWDRQLAHCFKSIGVARVAAMHLTLPSPPPPPPAICSNSRSLSFCSAARVLSSLSPRLLSCHVSSWWRARVSCRKRPSTWAQRSTEARERLISSWKAMSVKMLSKSTSLMRLPWLMLTAGRSPTWGVMRWACMTSMRASWAALSARCRALRSIMSDMVPPPNMSMREWLRASSMPRSESAMRRAASVSRRTACCSASALPRASWYARRASSASPSRASSSGWLGVGPAKMES